MVNAQQLTLFLRVCVDARQALVSASSARVADSCCATRWKLPLMISRLSCRC